MTDVAVTARPITRARSNGSRIAMLALAAAVCGVSAARDSNRAPRYGLAFASFAPVNTDIFVADADGSHARPLVSDPALDTDAAFAPDGRGVVFTSTRDGVGDIYRADVDGSGLTRLTNDPAYDGQGAWSPDGRSLAFVSSRSGQADIWILDLQTGATRNLTGHPAGDFRPAWSPDGQWIAFSSDRESRHPRAKAQFFPLQSTEIFIVRSDGGGLRQITHNDAVVGSPSWSADGRSLFVYEASLADVENIVSVRRLRGTTQIVRIEVASGERTELTSGPGEKWSPQPLAGGRIGYASGGLDGGVEFVGGAPGARGEIRNPHWSPDGSRLVFQREMDSNWPPFQTWSSREPTVKLVRMGVFPSWRPAGDLAISNDQTAAILHNSIMAVRPDGTQRAVLFTDPERSVLAPVWSRQGDRIAFGFGRFFQTVLGDARADVAVVDANGTGLQVLTDGSGNVGFPDWSPDGRSIVYRQADAGKNGLFILDVQTRAVRPLTSGGHENFPSWSPNGDRIAFTSDRGGDYEIYSIEPDGTDLRQLTHSPGNDAHNAWSPDGEWIAFTSARGGFKDETALHPGNPQAYGDIYVMRADGSDVRIVTDNPYEEGTPAWFAIAPNSRAARR
jgi:Tol biopolymer transport system component